MIDPAELAAKGFVLERGRYVKRRAKSEPASTAPVARAKLSPDDRLSSAERKYETWLEAERIAGRVEWWRRCRVKLILADALPALKGTTYTPDYEVIAAGGEYQLHEVKGGFTREDALVKFKIAVAQNPHLGFVFAVWSKGSWGIKYFKGEA